MRRRTCTECGVDIPYEGSHHDESSRCFIGRELRKIEQRGLIAVSPPAPTSEGHTNRVGTIAVCKIFGLDYKLVPSNTKLVKPWVCVTPEVEATLRAVNETAKYMMVVIPEAARRLVDRRDVLIEFDAHRRLGADFDTLYEILAVSGACGAQEQFEANAKRRNPNRSDRSIALAWQKKRVARMRTRRRIHVMVTGWSGSRRRTP